MKKILLLICVNFLLIHVGISQDTQLDGDISFGINGNQKIRQSTGEIAGEDFHLVNEQGTTWQRFSLIDGSAGMAGFKFQRSTNSGADWADLMSIKYNGNVGVGTSSPTYKLDVQSTGAGSNLNLLRLSVDNYATGSSWGQLLISGDGNLIKMITGTDDGFSLGSNNKERLRILANGNIGIGTTSPDQSLEIYSNSANEGIKLNMPNPSIWFKDNTNGNKTWSIYNQGNDNGLAFLSMNDDLSSPLTRLFIQHSTGNVGIGTTSPNERLEVEDGAMLFSNLGQDDNVSILKFAEATNYEEFELQGMFAGTGADNNSIKYRSVWTDNILVIKGNGNIGIGTTSPGSFKLAVEGKIGAHEVVVTTDGWSDFVFEPDYNLLSLKELNNFIQENKHLPEIPTTKEVEEKGISVGEMNAKLLQKIEELTLYTIQQQEVIDMQEQQYNDLKNEIEELKKLIKKRE